MSETTLPTGWAWTTIGDITQPIEKVQPKDKPNKEFIYLDISSIDNKAFKIVEPKHYVGADAPSRARQLVKAHDVLFSTVRTYLMNIAPVPDIYDAQIGSTGFSVLRAEQGISPQYLFYYCLTPEFLDPLEKLQRGTSYPAVRDGDVRAQPFPLPPLAEQHRIVAEIEKQLTRLDAGVAALHRAQARLQRYKAAVLKAACEGRLVSQDPTDEPAAVLLERILTERREQWNGKGKYKEPQPPASPPLGGTERGHLPELPEGWVWAKIEQLTDLTSGIAFKKREYSEIGVRLLQIANVTFGKIIWDSIAYLPEDYLEKYPHLVLKPGDLLMALNRPILNNQLKIGILKIADAPAILYQRVGRFDFYLPDIRSYFYIFAQSPVFIGQLQNSLQGVDQPFVTKSKLMRFPIPLPPLAEQQRIVAEVERRLSVVEEVEAALSANLHRAERLRQSVLKQAFEGRLVPQDPSDEPASVLLERIRAAKDGGKGRQMELPGV